MSGSGQSGNIDRGKAKKAIKSSKNKKRRKKEKSTLYIINCMFSYVWNVKTHTYIDC